MEQLYILILAIAGMFTAALTVIKIYSMKRSSIPAEGCLLHGKIETKIKNLYDGLATKLDSSRCDDRYEAVRRELTDGHSQFEAILKVQSTQAEMLARIDERVEYLAEQNGFGKRKK